jgi:CubicO group peptidase (beta-lactamase class C family)
MEQAVLGEVDALARESGFSGVVAVGDGRSAYGAADRAHDVSNTVTTRFAMASGSKGMTALVVMSLVGEGALALDLSARELLGEDLPEIDDAVTVEHLLSHRSGIGDCLDEEQLGDIDDYVMTRPPYELDTTEAFLPMLEGHPQKFPPGERFCYCNGGFVVLALLAERAGGIGYHQLVEDRVLRPAGMTHSGFLRSDRLPGDAAVGYLKDGRTNVFHLPVLGNGDGGLYTTAGDVAAFWEALFAGRIVDRTLVQEMVRGRPVKAEEGYGLGFWTSPTAVGLTGTDAGVAFHSVHDPADGRTWTVLGNDSEGTWPLVRLLRAASGTPV